MCMSVCMHDVCVHLGMCLHVYACIWVGPCMRVRAYVYACPLRMRNENDLAV